MTYKIAIMLYLVICFLLSYDFNNRKLFFKNTKCKLLFKMVVACSVVLVLVDGVICIYGGYINIFIVAIKFLSLVISVILFVLVAMFGVKCKGGALLAPVLIFKYRSFKFMHDELNSFDDK